MHRRIVAWLLVLGIFVLSGCTNTGNGTTEDEIEKNELVTVKVYDQLGSNIGITTGWMGLILAEELGIQVEAVHEPYDENGETGSADIIVHANSRLFENALSGESSYYENIEYMEWSNEFLAEHGENITKYLQKQVDYITGLTGGVQCGFVGNAAIEAAELSVVSRDGEDAIVKEISGNGAVFTISSKSEHPEAAMKLLNWLANPDNTITTLYGPRGVCWDKDESGYYYLTEFGFRCVNDLRTPMPDETLGSYGNGFLYMIGKCWNYEAVNPDSLHGERFNWKTWYLMQEAVH